MVGLSLISQHTLRALNPRPFTQPTEHKSRKGVRRRGLTRLKPPPKFKKKIIIYSFKYGAFYVLQFVQRSQFHSHLITIVFIDEDAEAGH